jgi:hypothetical protein
MPVLVLRIGDKSNVLGTWWLNQRTSAVTDPNSFLITSPFQQKPILSSRHRQRPSRQGKKWFHEEYIKNYDAQRPESL